MGVTVTGSSKLRDRINKSDPDFMRYQWCTDA